jgi:penicillin-binding protein 1A
VAEAAMLAGLPKAPSAYNPVVNPTRARKPPAVHPAAHAHARLHHRCPVRDGQGRRTQNQDRQHAFGVHAEYVAEMARQLVYEQFKEDTYTRGLNVFTTITKADQDAAYLALRRGVMDYERRHPYRGPESYLDIPKEKDRSRRSDRSRSWPSIRTATTSSPPSCCKPRPPW